MEKVFGKIRNHFRKRSVAANIITIIIWLFVFAYSLSILIFYVWLLLACFKSRIDWATNVFGLPKKFVFGNFKNAMKNFSVPIIRSGHVERVYIGELLINSLFYILGCAAAATIAPAIVAYATSKFNFRFNALIDGIVIVTMVLPIIGSDASLIQLSKTLGLYDHFLGIYFMKFHFLGFDYLLFKSAFKGVDKAYSESAYLDGASEMCVMVRINFPMVANIFLIVFMLQLMGFWADWTTPLIYMPHKPTVAYALYELQFTNEPTLKDKPLQFAACILASLPTLAIFMIFREKIMGGVAFGGLKG